MIKAPWHLAMEQQIEIHKWLITEQGADFMTAWLWNFYSHNSDYDEREKSEEVLTAYGHIVQTVYRADTMFVTSDMLNVLSQASHDLPSDITMDRRFLITPVGFCVFEEPLIGTDKNGKDFSVDAIAWEDTMMKAPPTGGDPVHIVVVYFFTDPANEIYADMPKAITSNLVVGHYYPIEDGEVFPDYSVPGSELVSETMKLFWAMQLLAQQRIGEPMKIPAPRPTRKRHRDYFTDGMKYISLITLRRKSVKHDDDDHQKREYSHRFMVKGHWRRQWYSSVKQHNWKYIYEHVKGPDDKPLILRERRVFNFRR